MTRGLCLHTVRIYRKPVMEKQKKPCMRQSGCTINYFFRCLAQFCVLKLLFIQNDQIKCQRNLKCG